MLRKLFTNKQLSKFFQGALLLHIAVLCIDLLTTHFLPTYQNLDFYFYIFEQISVFIIAFIIISQALRIFVNKHQTLFDSYKLFALTLYVSIAVFLFWVLSIDSDIQENFIEFIGSVSISNHSYKVFTAYVLSFMFLLKEFYQTLENPEHINEKSIPEIIYTTIRIVCVEHFLIFVSLFGLNHFKKLYKFSYTLLVHTHHTIMSQLSLLEILIPCLWIAAIFYYLYKNFKKIILYKDKKC